MPCLSNPKRERFAQELAKGKPAYIAHKVAGLSGDRGHASRLQRDSSIVHRIAEIMDGEHEAQARATEKAIEALAIDKQWVLARLVSNVERSMQAEPVMRGGVETGEFRYDGTTANRALELIGKELGMFIDRSEVSSFNHVVSDTPVATADEWEAKHGRTSH